MSRLDATLLECDVLVVGGGLAGCWAALRASDFTSRVILADKGTVARAGTAVFCHDLLAPLPSGQEEAWLQDVVEHSDFLSDQQFAQVLLEEEGARIYELARWGVPFEKDEKGELFLSLGRGQKNSRVVLCDCRKLMEVMRARLETKKVELAERIMVTDLLTSDGCHPTRGRVVGAVGLHTRTGEFVVFKAKTVFLSTGMAGAKMHLSYCDNVTGDGQAMAYRAGAEMAGLEFNFGPDFITPFKNRLFLFSVLWPLQTQGAYIVNGLGERFMERYAPERKERRSTQGLISQAMARELLEGRGPIYFDMRHFTLEHFQQLKRILPIRMAAFDMAGIDPCRELVPCRPIVSNVGGGGCGGIRISLNGETNLPGLFAGGVTAQQPCCVESLSGLKLGFCNVFGYRAGEQMGKLAAELAPCPMDVDQAQRLKQEAFAPARKESGLPAIQIYRQLNQKRTRLDFSIIKSAETISEMLAEIRKAREETLPRAWASDIHELVKVNEVRNFIGLLEPLYRSSLERKESRLSHYRLDFPFRDDVEWLKWVAVKREDASVTIRHIPLPLEDYPVKLSRREKVPAPVQFKEFFQVRK